MDLKRSELKLIRLYIYIVGKSQMLREAEQKRLDEQEKRKDEERRRRNIELQQEEDRKEVFI